MLPDWVKLMLSENKLDEYIEIFEKNKLDTVEILSDLDDNDLINIGINILGDRKKLLNIFKNKESDIPKPVDSNFFKQEEVNNPIIIQNPMVKGEDFETSFNRSFGGGLGGIVAGILGVILVIVIVLALLSNETFNF